MTATPETQRPPARAVAGEASALVKAQADSTAGERVCYSRGTGKYDNTPTQRTAEDFAAFRVAVLADRARRKGEGMICAAMAPAPDTEHHRSKRVVGKPYRSADTALPRRFVGLDLDGCPGLEALAEVCGLLSRYSGFGYTTASHTPDAPRARFVIELEQELPRVSLIAASAALRSSLSEKVPGLGWDSSCDRPEQPLFLPPVGADVFRFDGDPYAPAEPAQAPPAGNLSQLPPARAGGAVIVATNRHADVLELTKSLARIVVFDGMAQQTALAALRIERDSGRWQGRRIDDGELVRALDGAVANFREGKWSAPSAVAVLGAPPATTCAADLLGREFPPVTWALHDILPEGVSILSGDPKIGKSWLVLQACIAIATGTPLWPGRDPEQAGEALYLSLEDNERRLQRRISKLLPVAAEGRKLKTAPIGRLHLATEWPRAQAGVLRIAEWLRAHADARIVAVDTIGAFRDVDPGRKSAYAHDYALGELFKPLAREFRCAIVLVSHNRKQGDADPLAMVSGTQGLTGGVDNVVVLRRVRGALDAGLFVDGRDIENPTELALRFNDGRWSGVGTVADAQRSRERKDVLDALEDLGGEAKAKPIAEALGIKYGTARKRLHDMVRDGELRSVAGTYSRP